MAEITIPDDLLKRVEDVRSDSVTTEEFVIDAVSQKLAFQERRAEFFRLFDETRRLMVAKRAAK